MNGSYHKLVKGYNSHNGYYNLTYISQHLIKFVENAYNIKLPSINHWFLQRVDVAKCYNLNNQQNISNYINNLNNCNFPRRKLKHYEGESIYLTGSTTTLKIYNKKQEFLKHDFSKLKTTKFNIENYLTEIDGFIRFECEIRKRKLKYVFHKDYIRVNSISYTDLEKIWYNEFSKLLKLVNNDLTIINNRDLIKQRLYSMYKSVRAKNLYNFYLLILVQGLQTIKKDTNRSMYYKNISDLKNAGIDFSQKFNIDTKDNRIDFNPFESKEIL